MKKAMAIGKMVSAVIIILLIVAFVIMLVKIRIGTLRILEDSECKSSIATHVMLLRTTGEAMVMDIYCPTKYYTVPKEFDEQIKYHMAEALKTCWGTWGQGKLRLFEDEGKFCHMCSVISFNEKGKKITGLNDYLITTPYEPKGTLTYMDYLAGYASEEADPALIKEIQDKGFPDTIDTSKTYASMFVYVKGEGNIKEFLDNMDALGLGTTGGGITTGLVVGTVGTVIASAAGVALSGGTAIVVVGIVTVIGGVIGYKTADDVDWISLTIFTEYNAETLKKIGCEISPVKQVKSGAVT